MRTLCARKLADPVFLRRFHAICTVVWIILIIPSVLFWKESIVWVVMMSAWANVAGHFSSWQATRVEVKQDAAAPAE